MTKTKINWGILSTANIGVEKVIPAIKKSPSSNVLGIASRNAGRSARVANDLGIQKSYASYEALIADPEIDAIYNPLPNHMHVDWTLAAAQAGHHADGRQTYGHALAVDPWGAVLADLGEEAPALRVVTLDLGAVARARAQVPAWGIAPPGRIEPVRMGG